MMQELLISITVSSLRVRTAKNVSYLGASQLLIVALNLITLTVLANLLSAEDMGIIGIALVFLSLLYNIHDFGVMSAVIQRDTRVDESISAGITLRWIISAILMVSVLAVSPVLSDLTGIPDLWIVLVILSVNLLAVNFAFAPQARISRELRFSHMAIANTVQAAVLAGVAIPLALLDWSYWSFIFGSVAGTAGYVICLNLFRRESHAPSKDLALAKELLAYGKHLLASGLMMFAIVYADQIAIAGAMGVATLGVYFVAVRFGRNFGEQIALTINRVLFPTLARIKEDLESVKRGLVQSLRIISIVATPIAAGMSAASPLIIKVLIGPEWIAAIFPLSVLCYHGLATALTPSATNVLMAIGKPKYLTIQTGGQAVVLFILIFPVAHYFGIDGVAVLTTVLSICFLGYLLWVVASELQSRILDIMRPAMPSLLSGVIMFVPTAYLAVLLPVNPLSLIGLLGFAGLLYVAVLQVTSKGKDVKEALDLVRTMFSGRTAEEPSAP